MRRVIYLLAIGCLSLVSLNIQAGSNGKSAQDAKIEALRKQCEALSTKEKKISLIKGMVTRAYTMPLPASECGMPIPQEIKSKMYQGDPPKCQEKNKNSFTAILKDTDISFEVNYIFNTTKAPEHMVRDRKYILCARELPASKSDLKRYLVDDISLILEMQE